MSCKHSDYFGSFQGLRKYFQGFCIKIVEFLIRLPWLLKLPIDRLGIILTIRYLFGAIRMTYWIRMWILTTNRKGFVSIK